jgi:dethiobiotin synthetase
MSGELRGCFVTGTDTGVGKTVVAAAIVARLRDVGTAVRVVKPLITGLEDPPAPDWPPDHELLARVAGCEPTQVILAGFGPPVSPHLAIELARVTAPTLEELADGVRAIARPGAVTVVEGVGGLLVPLGPDADVRDLAGALGLPLVIAARPGLGTINHTLLTLEAARSAGLTVAGVVLTPWPPEPSVIERSNRQTIARLGEVDVAALPPVLHADPELLAAAGAELPLERWLAGALRSDG